MEWINQFDELKSSALKELANIGISHVATAIGEISKEKIDISLPQMSGFSKSKLLSEVNQNGSSVAAYLTVDGISNFTETLIVLSKPNALELMNKFINVEGVEEIKANNLSSEDQKSIFSEVTSVIASTFFSAVDSMFNLKTRCGVPQISFNNGEFSDFIQKTMRNNEGISINVSFTSDKSKLSGNLLLIPDPNSVDVFFKSIGLVA